MIRDIFSPEERAESDALMYEAGHDEHGQVRPSGEIGPRLHDLLKDAIQAGRTWAVYTLDDAVEEGCRSIWKRWEKHQKRVRVFYHGRLVPKTAVMGVVRRSPETGQAYHQQALWDDMTADELRGIVASARGRIEAEKTTVATALRLLSAVEETGAASVSEAMIVLRTTLDEFLAGIQAA